MSFSGETYAIPFDRGGLSGDRNVDKIPAEMMTTCKNINFNQGGRGKRGGTAKVNSTVITSTPQIMGGYDYILTSGSQYLMAATSDGKIITVDSTGIASTLKTGLVNNKVTSFARWNNVLYVTNSADIPQTWDGSAGTTSALGNLSADWAGVSYPAKMLVHGYGNSERMWAWGCPSNPNSLYYSADNTGSGDPNFSTGGSIYINTNDGYGIVAVVEFGDRLICFGKTQSFVILDTDASTANWGYSQAQWVGGAATHRLVCTTPNDIIAMMDDGTIYSATAVQSYGDYKRAEISKPAYIDQWIKSNLSLTSISSFHMIYDDDIRAVRLFAVKTSGSVVKQCLLFFIDRPPAEAWSLHENDTYISGFDASSSWMVRTSTGTKCYTGDYSGFVWKLEQTNKSDDSNSYYSGFTTSILTFGDARVTKHYYDGRLIATPTGNFTVYIKTIVDGVLMPTTQSVTLSGSGGLLGSFILGTSLLGGGTDLVEKSFEIGNEGKRIQHEIYNSAANQDLFLSQYLIDFKPLSKKV